MAETLYTSGDAAKCVGMTAGTIKLWELRGWVTPSLRTVGGIHLFTETQVETMRRDLAARTKARMEREAT